MQNIPYEELFKWTGKMFGIDWRILAAQAWAESGFDPKCEGDFDANGNPRALGLGQFWEATWEQVWKDTPGVPWEMALEPNFAIPAMGIYMDWLRETIRSKVPAGAPADALIRLSLGAYNWGIGNVLRTLKKYERWSEEIWQEFPETTRIYIQKITDYANNTHLYPENHGLCQTNRR